MDATNWTWIVLIALLVFCCVPMLFMGRHRGHKSRGTTEKREAHDEHGRALFATVRTLAISGLLLTRLLWPFVTRPYADFCNRRALLRMRDKFLERNFAEASKPTAAKRAKAGG